MSDRDLKVILAVACIVPAILILSVSPIITQLNVPGINGGHLVDVTVTTAVTAQVPVTAETTVVTSTNGYTYTVSTITTVGYSSTTSQATTTSSTFIATTSSSSATSSTTVGSPSISLSPTSIPLDSITTVSVSGSGFSASDTTCSFSGPAIDLPLGFSCSISKGVVSGQFDAYEEVSGPIYSLTVTGAPGGDSASATITAGAGSSGGSGSSGSSGEARNRGLNVIPISTGQSLSLLFTYNGQSLMVNSTAAVIVFVFLPLIAVLLLLSSKRRT